MICVRAWSRVTEDAFSHGDTRKSVYIHQQDEYNQNLEYQQANSMPSVVINACKNWDWAERIKKLFYYAVS